MAEVAGVLIGLIVLFIWGMIDTAQEESRVKELSELADRLGLNFDELAREKTLDAVKSASSLANRHDLECTNELSGKEPGFSFSFFDAMYSSGTTEKSRTYEQTVFVVCFDEVELPDLDLSLRRFFHVLAVRLGLTEADMKNLPDWSDNFAPGRSKGDMFSSVLNPDTLSLLQDNLSISVDAHHNTLVAYKWMKRFKLSQIEEFMNAWLEVSRILLHGEDYLRAMNESFDKELLS